MVIKVEILSKPLLEKYLKRMASFENKAFILYHSSKIVCVLIVSYWIG